MYCNNNNNNNLEVNEVNGTESEALPVTFDALKANFAFNEVNGTESVLTEAVEGNVSYKNNNVQELNCSVAVPELNHSVVESVVPVVELNYSQVESVVAVEEVNCSALGNGIESVVSPMTFDALESNFCYSDDVRGINYSVVESSVPVQEENCSVEVNKVNGTESEVFIVTESELNSSLVESVVPLQDVNSVQVESVVPLQELDSSMVESVIPTNGATPMRCEPIEEPEGSNSMKSRPLSSLSVLNVATSDNQQSIEKELSSVTPESVGSGKLERVRESGIRRSPRLLTVASSPQTGGTKKGGSKLKRVRSSVDEVNVEGGNGSCEKVELTGSSGKKQSKRKLVSVFVGEPVPEHEARERWGWRYELKDKRRKGRWVLNAGEEDEVHVNVECHYLQANVNGCIFSLGDCAHIKGEGNQPHVGRIVEFFKTTDDEKYFRVQWFFRAEDTVMKKAAAFHDKKRLFYSTIMNDNLLECILSKVKVIEKAPMLGFQSTSIQPSEYYCDMEYSVKYSTFRSLVTGKSQEERACLHNMSAIHMFPSIRKKGLTKI